MARRITIPSPDWSKIDGFCAIIPVKVDWPELQLTDDAILVNAVAAVNGDEPPYPDLSIIKVVIERPTDA